MMKNKVSLQASNESGNTLLTAAELVRIEGQLNTLERKLNEDIKQHLAEVS